MPALEAQIVGIAHTAVVLKGRGQEDLLKIHLLLRTERVGEAEIGGPIPGLAVPLR